MRNILVVEDNEKMAEFITEIFQLNGFVVSVADNGREAWQRIQDQVPDVVISDVNMPDIDGFQLLAMIRRDETYGTLPVILLTAEDERDSMRHGMTLGADDYVTKPFRAKEILHSVDTVLKKRERLVEEHQTSLRRLRHNITYALPHELRTPLQSVIGYASLLQMDYETASPDDVKMIADTILEAGLRLERLVENTLVYAQLEIIATDSEKQEQLRNNVVHNPSSHLEKVASKVAHQHNRGHDLSLHLNDNAKTLKISERNLIRLAEEIIENAFKFSQSDSEVRITTSTTDQDFMLEVQDFGRGMSAEQVQLIGAYMQFDRALYEQQGLGMGLIIAKRLVELHHGVFEVESHKDDGTTITIKLPLQ